jgi:hypothetical protein
MTDPAAANPSAAPLTATTTPQADPVNVTSAPPPQVTPGPASVAVDGALGETAAQPTPSALERATAAAAKVSARAARRRNERAERDAAVAYARQAEQAAFAERQRAEAAEAKARAFDADPLGEVRRRGIPDKAIAQAAIDDTSPEARAARAEQRAEQVAQEFEAFRREQQRGVTQAAVREAESGFVRDAIDKASQYAHTAAHAKVRPAALLAEANALLASEGPGFYRRYGRTPTNAEILDCLNKRYAAAAKLMAPGGAEKTETGGEPAKVAPGGAGAKTLTGKAGEKATIGTHWSKLPPDEQLAGMAAEFRQRSAR